MSSLPRLQDGHTYTPTDMAFVLRETPIGGFLKTPYPQPDAVDEFFERLRRVPELPK
jgi:hypothetical protein